MGTTGQGLPKAALQIGTCFVTKTWKGVVKERKPGKLNEPEEPSSYKVTSPERLHSDALSGQEKLRAPSELSTERSSWCRYRFRGQ